MNTTPSCSCGCSGSHACDCCTGPRVLTPLPIYNAPGRSVLHRRAGDWDTFRRTMQARLSEAQSFPALQNLTTREPDDPSIALLDAAAVVGDVLTFYSERFANEGYLRTATERRSLVELGKLIGYSPRPGVAASAWLAFTLDTGYNVTIPAGTRAQSIPASSTETAQTFETSADLAARAELNVMAARASVPQEISPANVLNIDTVWLKGTGLNLKAGDMLLFAFPDDEAASTPRKVHTVTEDALSRRTTVKLEVEKLSAAYYVPALRKSAQALRRTLPDAWLADDRPWAKNIAAALDGFSGALGADSSLLDIEDLFKPADNASQSLSDYLTAVETTASVARSMTEDIQRRSAWEENVTSGLRGVLKRAAVQETLLEAVFAKLTVLDATTAAQHAERNALAGQIAGLLAEGTAGVPGAIQSCFEPALTSLRNLRSLASIASTVAANGWNNLRLGGQGVSQTGVRAAANEFGFDATAGESRRDAADLLAALNESLSSGGISASVAGDLLDDDGDFVEKIDDAETPAKIGELLTAIHTALVNAWKTEEDVMRANPAAGVVDATLKSVRDLYTAEIDDLPAATDTNFGDRATALAAMAIAVSDHYNGTTGANTATGSKGDLARISIAGVQATALKSQRAKFQAESFSGLRRSILLLTGRYKNSLPEFPEIAAKIQSLEAKTLQASAANGLAALRDDLAVTLLDVITASENNPGTKLDRLRAELVILDGQVAASPSGSVTPSKVSESASGAALENIVSGSTLLQPAAPGDPLSLTRSLATFVSGSGSVNGVASDAVSRLAGRLAGSTDDELFAAWRRLNTGTPAVEVYAMRVMTNVFGAGAPMRFGTDDETGADKSFDARFDLPNGDGDWRPAAADLGGLIRLEGEQSKVVRDSYLVIERPLMVEMAAASVAASTMKLQPLTAEETPAAAMAPALAGKSADEMMFLPVMADLKLNFAAMGGLSFALARESSSADRTLEGKSYREALYTRVRRAEEVLIAPHSAYSLSGKATTVNLLADEDWGDDPVLKFEIIRRARVYAASELLTLAEVPIERVVGVAGSVKDGRIERTSANPFSESDNVLMLDGLYQGIEAGHRLIVTGERTGDYSVRPVQEYALVSSVEHALIPAMSKPGAPLAGDTPHTRITLSGALQYDYRRSTLKVYGNVAEATHGETRKETLGGGNARLVNQRFELRSVPVTHTAAATATGAESTVVLRVDKVQWHSVTNFIEAGPDDRVFVLEIGDDGKTYAVFGDGQQGARLPTGVENVTVQYRQGLGQGGNVRAEGIMTALDKPLGVKAVINPLAASGGADRDGVEDIRYNAPLPLLALDRLVSVSDYAAFARAYAGIGKAEAALLGGAGGALVHVTIAGQDDAAIADDSSLMTALTESLVMLGDPLLAVRVQSRELLVLMLSASVRIQPDYAWADVEAALRSAVLAAFGFERRQPGQDVFLSELIAVMQRVPGVDFVDVDAFGGVPEKMDGTGGPLALTPEQLVQEIIKVTGAPPQPRLAVAPARHDSTGQLRPAQLALFLCDLPETLILNQLVS